VERKEQQEQHTAQSTWLEQVFFSWRKYLVLGGLFVLLLAAGATGTYLLQAAQLREVLLDENNSINEVFQAQITSDSEGLARALAGLTRIEPLLAGLAEKNRDKLLAAAAPIFADMKAKNNITHTYFIDREGVVILRVHNPGQFGDKVDRHSFKLARDNGKLGVSLELGKSNVFSLRAVVPVSYNGAPVGYMEVAQEIDHVFDRTRAVTRHHATAFLSKEYQKRKGAEAKGAIVEGFNLIHSTEQDTALKLMTTQLANGGMPSGLDVRLIGNYFVGFAPLKDGAGEVAGVSMFHHDATEELQAMWSRIAGFTLLQAAIILIGLAAVGWGANRVAVRALGGTPAYARGVAAAIAAGDLRTDVALRAGDRGSLLAAMKSMRDELKALVTDIYEGANTVKDASSQIAQGNAELSNRTEEQASSLEETASSMEELTTTVKQNTEHARQANALAIGASDVAGQGGRVMGEVIQTMGGIAEASRRIADIIAVIDGIAFQTNLLALNAAVEAARAGEQGRGFAVVASEVRNLAQRSAAAAKEVKELIQTSVDRVDSGTRRVKDAGKTMEEIVASVKQVTDIVSEIAAASQQQLGGIEQVGSAIMQMDRVVQQNAAIVEQSAAAAENMAAQAEELVQAVSRFQLDGVAAARPKAQTAPALAPRLTTARNAPAKPRAEVSESQAPLAVPPAHQLHKSRGNGQTEWTEI
jgi:methyl-accepting chemotaxis protein